MEVVSIKRGRGRPKGSKSSNPKEKVIVLVNGEKRGRGRPRKDQTNIEKIKVETTPSLPIVKIKTIAANIPVLSQSNETSTIVVKRGRGRPRKDGSNPPQEKVVSQVTIKREKKKDELDEKFEKERAQFLAAHTNESSKFVHIPTLVEIEYQKNTQVKTSAHELIIAEEIQKQKDKPFRHIMSNAGVSKPNITKLQDVCYINHTDEGRHISFNAEVGDEIIVEWPQNWRKTETWRIDEINEESGNVRLKNTEEFYYGGINFITGPTVYGIKIKKPNKEKNEKAKQF